MTTEAWPCWRCRWRSAADSTGTYSCTRPIDESKLAIWERWNLQPMRQMWRALGTEKQLRGETANDRPDCPVMEGE